MEWNFNIDDAPKPRMEILKCGKEDTKNVFVAERVLVATFCGNILISNILESGRWEFLGTKELPLAWAPIPKHPNEIET